MATKSSKPVGGSSKKPAPSKKEPKTPASSKTAPLKGPKPVKPKNSAGPLAAVTPRKKRPTKAAPSKPGSSYTLDPRPVAQEPVIPHEEISLRAYFISERRQKMGWPGDPATDWTDAVSQLRAEALQKPFRKR